MGYFHIYAPEVTNRAISSGHCPDCKRNSRFVSFFQDWFGWHSTCLRCGRSWDDGEWLPLEFERASRRKSVERAKKRWRKLAASGTPTRRAETTGSVGEADGGPTSEAGDAQ